MALPYPEGEVFFKRSALNDSLYDWSADNKDHFWDRMLIEYVYNKPFQISSTNDPTHPRSHLRTYDPSGWDTNFDAWSVMSVGFSKADDKENWLSTVDIELCNEADIYREYDKGDPNKVTIRSVPIDKRADFVYIDLLAPVRAIYFPLVYQCGEAFPDLCSYLMVDFKTRNKVTFRDPSWQPPPFTLNPQLGLGFLHGYTLVIDLKRLYYYLFLPHQLRNPDMDLYTPKNSHEPVVSVCGPTQVGKKWGTLTTQPFHVGMDYAHVISENFGVDLVWAPNEYSSFLVNMLVHMVEMGLEFIPVVGPMMSIGFGVAASLIQNPDTWQQDDVLGLGALDIGALVMGSCLDSGKKAQKYTVTGFVQSGESEAAPVGGAPSKAPAATTQGGIFPPSKESTEAIRNQSLKDKALRVGLDLSAPLEKKAQENARREKIVQTALKSLKHSLRDLSGSKGT